MTDWVARALNFRRGELPLALLAALFNFCVLAGYYFLRPVRDAMGVSRGMDDLRWLFAATSVFSLFFVLVFGGVVSRMDRRRFIPLAYLFVIACLAVFAGLLVADVRAGGGLIGTDSETAVARWVGYTFYVWISVINLFVTSVLWAYLVDVFDIEQGKRLFPFIGVGGTLGALFGSWATKAASELAAPPDPGSGLAPRLDPELVPYLPVGLMLTGAALFAVAIALMLVLDRAAVRSGASRLEASRPRHTGRLGPTDPREIIGGTFWEGLAAVARSPYLLGIGGFIVLMTVSNTLIYFTQAHIVSETTDSFSELVEGFAQFDLLANVATLLTQMFITTRVIRRLGVGWTLAILPLVTLAGFAVLAVWPVYGVMAVFQALHRATRYAVARPSRETLFSVVPPAEKYKAKPVIDVFLYRGGDLAGLAVNSLLAWAGLGLGALAAATLPFAAAWGALSVGLGRAQTRRSPDAAPGRVPGDGAG